MIKINTENKWPELEKLKHPCQDWYGGEMYFTEKDFENYKGWIIDVEIGTFLEPYEWWEKEGKARPEFVIADVSFHENNLPEMTLKYTQTEVFSEPIIDIESVKSILANSNNWEEHDKLLSDYMRENNITSVEKIYHEGAYRPLMHRNEIDKEVEFLKELKFYIENKCQTYKEKENLSDEYNEYLFNFTQKVEMDYFRCPVNRLDIQNNNKYLLEVGGCDVCGYKYHIGNMSEFDCLDLKEDY